MAEPYNIYDALQDRGSVSRLSFPGYVSTAAPPLASHSIPVSTEFPGACSDFLQRDINPLQLGSYGLNGYSGVGFRPEPVIGGVMPGASGKGYSSPLEDPSLLAQRGDASMHAIGGAIPGATGKGYPSPLEDPGLLSQRGDASVRVTAAIPDMINDRPGSLRSADGPPVPKGESNILFVDGLPTDCTRREVGRILIGYYPDLFRPFIGYKEIRVVHKEARKVILLLQYLRVKDLSLPSLK
ncbi:collagen alpha-1(IV) chain-like isoform X3 [Populus alba x Populus x berolinensis]|uniref:Collagen alpha-1(IV) chain-like isoform X3 n=1 Tax=Populus alba x Populus x berolinensis TaxID=444605 RepID=A0AAD6QQG1_9ROSI|nr:collagen alpha-1(IV) chain-like isoform X3 [Populus alba x Populus x berolinensis]